MSTFSPSSGRDHILAVNSSPEVLSLIHDVLSEEGYKVTTYMLVDRDLPRIANLAPDLIILDYQWATDDDGWSLLQMLRLLPATAAIPIILSTAAISHVEDTRGHLHNLGIEVLYKPFRIDTLLDVVRVCLSAQTPVGLADA